MLKEQPTLAEVKATGTALNVRCIEEDHGGSTTVLIYDVIHCDGTVCHYSLNVYDSHEEALVAIKSMDRAPEGWDLYTPR